jgi:hypothetical protein
MKKTTLILLALLLFALLSSCNMDATDGIYQSVMKSQTTQTEPISQIINYDSSTKKVLMLSSTGIMEYDGTTGTYKTLVTPKQVPHITRAFATTDDEVYFTNSVVNSDNTVTANYYKYNLTSDTFEETEDLGLNSNQSINYASSTGKVFINDSNAHTITLKSSGTQLLDYSTYISTAQNYGIEVRDKVTRLFVTEEDNPSSDDYDCINFLTNDTGCTEITGLTSNKWVVTGAITKDGVTYITAFDNQLSHNNYQIVIYKVDTDGKVDQDSSIKTGISARDFDLVLGKLGNYIFFHVYGRSPLYYFDSTAESPSIKQTSMSNLTSTIDFVTVLEATDDEVLIATSNKGFYKLTDVTRSSGFNRVSLF